jgi:hypothetical protein
MEAVLVEHTNPLRSHQRSSAEFRHGKRKSACGRKRQPRSFDLFAGEFQTRLLICHASVEKMPSARNRYHFPYSRIAISLFHLWHTPFL